MISHVMMNHVMIRMEMTVIGTGAIKGNAACMTVPGDQYETGVGKHRRSKENV